MKLKFLSCWLVYIHIIVYALENPLEGSSSSIKWGLCLFVFGRGLLSYYASATTTCHWLFCFKYLPPNVVDVAPHVAVVEDVEVMTYMMIEIGWSVSIVVAPGIPMRLVWIYMVVLNGSSKVILNVVLFLVVEVINAHRVDPMPILFLHRAGLSFCIFFW